MENQQQQPQTTQCRGGCGFYGSPATDGLCSKCFKDSIKRKQDTGSARLVSPNSSGGTSSADASTSTNISTASVVASVMANLGDTSSSVVNSALGSAKSDLTTALNPTESEEVLGSSPLSTTTQASSVRLVGVSSNASLASSCSTNSLEEPIIHDNQCPVQSSFSVTKKANRCHVCKKRVGLTGFACRCGGLYCGEHRYDQAHNCTFDYKTMEREELRKNNPVVVSDKIARI